MNNSLKNLIQRIEALGWKWFWRGNTLVVRHNHLRYGFPIRNVAVYSKYDGDLDVRGTEFSLFALDRLLLSYEDSPIIKFYARHVGGSNKEVLMFEYDEDAPSPEVGRYRLIKLR